MFHVIAIGNHSSCMLNDFQHTKIKFIHFKDYKEFLSCRLTLKKIDGFLLCESQKPKLISNIKMTYPGTVVISINDTLNPNITLSFLQAGAADVLFKPLSNEDIAHRLLARLIQFNSQQEVESTRVKCNSAKSGLPAEIPLSS